MRWRHLFLSFFLGLFFSVALTAQNLLPDPAAAGGGDRLDVPAGGMHFPG